MDKVFDKLDLLFVFDESGTRAHVGTYTTWRMPKRRGQELPIAEPVIHDVYAGVQAYFCEKGSFAIVRRSVTVSNGHDGISEGHAFLMPGFVVQTEAIDGAVNNAELVRKIVGIADQWRETVRLLVPSDGPGRLTLLTFEENDAEPDEDELGEIHHGANPNE